MITTIILIVVGAAFVVLGTAKLFGAKPLKDAFAELKLPQWLRYPIGIVELVGGLAFGAGAFLPPLAFFAAVPLLVICLAAIAIHLVRPPLAAAVPAFGLSLGLIGGTILQPLGLQIVALPPQDDMPKSLLSTTVLETFPGGSFLESVTVLADGSLAITNTTGINFMTLDTSEAIGQLIRRAPNGDKTVLLELPQGQLAGVSALGPDDTLYLTVTGGDVAVWSLTADGEAGVFAKAPEGITSLNGLTMGPDGHMYAAADRQGAVLRLNLETKSFEVVLQDELLLQRPFIALAPGINGLEFRGQELVMAVSDSAEVYGATLNQDGSFSALSQIATGIPGDDIAIVKDGTVYVTTHPYNTLVKVAPDGSRIIVADDTTNATGSTDVALARDGRSLYMVTDGGAFAGTPNAAGQLVQVMLSE